MRLSKSSRYVNENLRIDEQISRKDYDAVFDSEGEWPPRSDGIYYMELKKRQFAELLINLEQEGEYLENGIIKNFFHQRKLKGDEEVVRFSMEWIPK